MSKSIIYAGNSVEQTTTVAGTTLQFNNIVRRYGSNLNISGGNVVVEGSGYYEGDVNISFEGTAAGTLLVQVYKDGVAIPYANATVTAVDDTYTNISIPFVVRQTCGCTTGTITVVASGVIVDIVNAAIVVEKE